jgi:hypothetical protein
MNAPSYRDIETSAREKGYLWYFECDAKAPPIYANDSDRVRALKMHMGSCPTLFMERYLLAEDFEKVWTDQGWTVHVVRKTPKGHLGPRFMNKLLKVISTLEIGDWTMIPVEMSWAVVFATRNPADIRAFQNL